MKKLIAILFTMHCALFVSVAQTLNVKAGSVTYQFPASQTGEMTYANGETVTVMGKTFALSDISSMTVDNSEVTDNLVSVEYDSSAAAVFVAGNVAQYVDVSVSGAHVTIAQTNTDAVDGDEITCQLSGTTADGSLTLGGSYKCTVSLAGLTMTNPGGAAINITNGKRIQISAKNGTVNTLTDGANGAQKACIYSKGQIQLQGKGTLNVAGNTKHAIKSGDYISVKNLTLNVTKAVGDGISCNEYFQMKSGTVSISGVGDDGIQCDLDGTMSTGETADHEDEDSGNIYLEGGTLSVTVTAAAAKGIKAAGDMTVSGGSITATSSKHEAIETKGTLTITDGTVYALSSSDDAINSASHMYLQGGTVTGVSNGNDGIDTNGNMYISGGTIVACGARDPECGLDAAERYALYITGGTVLGIGGGNNTVTSTTGSQCVLSTSSSTYSAGTAVAIKNGSAVLASFTIPTGYSPSSSGGFRAPGGPGGGGYGGSGFSFLLSCPGLTSGSSYTVTIGSSSATCKAATSYSGR